MSLRKVFPLTLAAGAMLMTSFAAAPAHADDRAFFNLLAGATAIAIIADAANPPPRERVVVVHRDRRHFHRDWGWRHDRGWHRGGRWGHWHRHWDD